MKSVVVIPPQSSIVNSTLPPGGNHSNQSTSYISTSSKPTGGATTSKMEIRTTKHQTGEKHSPDQNELIRNANYRIPQSPFAERNILQVATNLNRLKNNNKEDESHKKQTSNTASNIAQEAIPEHQQDNENKERYLLYNELGTGEKVFVTLPPTPLMYKTTLNSFWPSLISRLWDKYPYYTHLYSTVRESAVPNYLKVRWPVPSALKISNWRTALKDYMDVTLVDFLAFGWPIDYTADGPPTPTYVNHARKQEDIIHIEKYIETELKHNALLGPFLEPPFQPWNQISPMMIRDKRDSEDKRIVVDLSFPLGKSVNAGIKKGCYQGQQIHFSLPSITDLAQLIIDEGPGTFIWSIDLARAYRQLRSCPLSIPLLGIQHNSKYYIDVCPPFGCRTSSLMCARTTAAVVWLLKQRGIKSLCYLDDFVGVSNSLEKAKEDYKTALKLLEYLGLDISHHKCIPPTTSLVWLGFKIDSISMSIEIPKEKLKDTLEEAKLWYTYKKASRKQLQSIVGKLKHISKCVPHADRFFSRILQQLRNTPQYGKHDFNTDLLQDIKWFENFASLYNGVYLLPTKQKQQWVIESDACLEAGGAWSETKFFSQTFSPSVLEKSYPITQLEALTVIHALKYLLPPDPQNFIIVLNTDNKASQSVLSSGKGRNPFLTACSRQLWLIASLNSTDIQVQFKPGASLELADALSRANINEQLKIKAKELCTYKNLKEVKITIDTSILNFTM